MTSDNKWQNARRSRAGSDSTGSGEVKVIVQRGYRELREGVRVGGKQSVRTRSSKMVVGLGVGRSGNSKMRPSRRSSRSNKRSSMRVQSDLEVVSSIGRSIASRVAQKLDFDGLGRVHLSLKSNICIVGLSEGCVLDFNRDVASIERRHTRV